MLASNDTQFFSILDAIYISWNTGITVAVKLIMTIERLLIPRNSPKRFGTRSDRADFCTVDCYTYCNKVEIHISTIITVAAPTTTTTTTNINGTTTAATTTTCSLSWVLRTQKIKSPPLRTQT